MQGYYNPLAAQYDPDLDTHDDEAPETQTSPPPTSSSPPYMHTKSTPSDSAPPYSHHKSNGREISASGKFCVYVFIFYCVLQSH